MRRPHSWLAIALIAWMVACGSAAREASSAQLLPTRPEASTTEPEGAAPDNDSGGACRDDADCAYRERCVNAACRSLCAVDTECPSGHCDLRTGFCAGARCLGERDCAPGEACEGGWCVAAWPTGVCAPHTTRCQGAAVVECAPDGSLELRRLCRLPCTAEGAGAHCGEHVCHPWSVGCLESGEAFACDASGSAFTVTECGADHFCQDGVCRTQVCEPRAVWCAGDALVTCDARGRSYEAIACADTPACASDDGHCVCRDGACEAVTCLPETARCVADGLQRCNEDGSGFLAPEPCGPDHACREGACHPVICRPGVRRCEGDTLLICDESGTQLIATDCLGEGAYCEGEREAAHCAEQLCRPSSAVCTPDGTGVVRCDGRGASTEVLACPRWGCSAGACLPEPAPEGWVRIEAGEFLMGSPAAEPGRTDYETRHEVRLMRAFFLQEAEVTQAEWEAVMGTRPSYFEDCDDCPVECVSFWDILVYANRLSEAEGRPSCYVLSGCRGLPGRGCAGEFLCEGDFDCDTAVFLGLNCSGYRLPTEAEWEYAARAGTETAFYGGPITELGSDPLDPVLQAIAWYAGNSAGTVHPARTRAPNPWGLYDISGNVFEFVWDWFAVDYETLDVVDPLGPPWGLNRVTRGGSWFTEAARTRSAYRHNLSPTMRVNSFGFRLARTSLSPLPAPAD